MNEGMSAQLVQFKWSDETSLGLHRHQRHRISAWYMLEDSAETFNFIGLDGSYTKTETKPIPHFPVQLKHAYRLTRSLW